MNSLKPLLIQARQLKFVTRNASFMKSLKKFVKVDVYEPPYVRKFDYLININIT